MSSKLPPLDLQEEVENFKSYQETTTLKEKHCPHKDVKYHDGTLRCICGSAWSGPGIDRLYRTLISR
jgi:hypothetical protein